MLQRRCASMALASSFDNLNPEVHCRDLLLGHPTGADKGKTACCNNDCLEVSSRSAFPTVVLFPSSSRMRRGRRDGGRPSGSKNRKPAEAPRNFEPHREPAPMERRMSRRSDTDYSQSCETEPMLQTRCARMAHTPSFDNSEPRGTVPGPSPAAPHRCR